MSCIGDPVPDSTVSQNCEGNVYPQYFCEVEDGGSVYLEESSKTFMPFYCREKESIIRYENNNNDEILFTIVNKFAFITPSTYNTFKFCHSDPSKYMAYCIKSDYVFINMVSQSANISLDINLRLRPEFKDGVHVGSGDFLEIYRKINLTDYSQELNFVVNQRSLSYSKTSEQEFYEVLELDGKLYSHVFTENNSFILPKKFQFYYSKTDGLVAFRDDKDVIWHLVN